MTGDKISIILTDKTEDGARQSLLAAESLIKAIVERFDFQPQDAITYTLANEAHSKIKEVERALDLGEQESTRLREAGQIGG